MTRKLQISTIFILFMLFALSNVAMAPAQQADLSPTPISVEIKPTVTATRLIRQPRATFTPAQPTKTKIAAASLAMQAGNSDWIMLIGIVIVAIITIPLLLKYKEWRAN